jgi:hypothetical protein
MDFRYKSYIMGKLDPNLLLLLVAGAGGLIWFTKFGGREMLEGMMSGGGAAPPATAVEPTEDTDPDPKAAQEEENTPEPRDPEAEEEWDDGKGNVYIIKIDGWMWVNNRRMYQPTHPDWERFYRMRKYNWRYRRCMAKYRNHSWCKNKHKFCVGAWRNTPWCRGFKRGIPHRDRDPWDRNPPPRGGGKPPRLPPHGGGGGPGPDTNNCPPFIYKNGKKYRFTRDPMPDVMPAIFPPPYVKEGNCVYKLDNNQGPGQNGRDGWDGDRGGSSSGGNWWDRISDSFSFYTYSRIGNV